MKARVHLCVATAIVALLLVSTAPVRATSPGSVRLMAVGDVMLAQSIGRRIARNGPLFPWRRVMPFFDQADLVLANLECTISTRGTQAHKDFTFRAPPAAAASLAAAGIDVVNMANNHAMDYGPVALADTLDLLDANGIGHVGGGLDAADAHAPLIVQRNGLRIAFLGYSAWFAPEGGFHMREWAAGSDTPGLAVAKPDTVAREVAAVRPFVDVVVVTIHGGVEYSRGPNERMRAMTRAAVEAGAALVIGHHPHVLQGYRRDGGTLIAYSVGNFVFDYFTGRMNDTVILDVTLTADGVSSLRWIPVVMVNNGIPRPAAGADAARILNRLKPI